MASRPTVPAVILLLVVSSPVTAAVIYDFTGVVNMFGNHQSFRYTAPSLITADTFVPAPAMDSCNSGMISPCFGIQFFIAGPDAPGSLPEMLFESLNPDHSIGKVFYFFPAGSSFGSYGTLNTHPLYGNNGALSISAPVPEPMTGATLALGIAALALLGCHYASRSCGGRIG